MKEETLGVSFRDVSFEYLYRCV